MNPGWHVATITKSERDQSLVGQKVVVWMLRENLSRTWQSGDTIIIWANGEHTAPDGLEWDVAPNSAAPNHQAVADMLHQLSYDISIGKRAIRSYEIETAVEDELSDSLVVNKVPGDITVTVVLSQPKVLNEEE
jgi:hypothetical protein